MLHGMLKYDKFSIEMIEKYQVAAGLNIVGGDPSQSRKESPLNFLFTQYGTFYILIRDRYNLNLKKMLAVYSK